MSKEQYLPGIDGLRAVAVLLVLFFHAGFSTFSGGYVGVDVFFVISGFLITRLIVREYENSGEFNFRNFYYKRAQRLLPALLTTVSITLVLAVIFFTPQHLRRFGAEAIFSTLSLSNFFFLSESGYFNTSSDFKPLLHTWSLSIEEQFYLFWPTALIVAMKSGKKHRALFLLCAIFAISLALNFSFSDGRSALTKPFGKIITNWLSDGAATLYFFSPMRLFEFSIGGMLVFLRAPNFNRWLYEAALASGVALIIYSAIFFDQNTLFPSYNALLPCIGAALVIFSCQSAPLTGSLIGSKPIVFIGLISYSVYLVHWPIFVFTKYWLMRDLVTTEKSALCFASIALGYALYRFIETPYRYSSSPKARTKFVMTCAVLASFVLLPAANMLASDGWKWRVKPTGIAMEEQLANSKQFHIDQYGGAGYPYKGWIHKNNLEKADIILIGDSHARHYAKGLDEVIGKPLNKNIYISSISCILLPDLTRTTPGFDWNKNCQHYLNDAIKVIKESPANSLVIISHNWLFQLYNAGLISTNEKLKFKNQAEAYHFASDKIKELSSKLTDRKILVIGDIPGSGVNDLIGCFSRPYFFRKDCNTITSVDQRSIKSAIGNSIMANDLNGIKNLTYVSPQGILCKNGKCKSIINGSVMYSDGEHLSKAGSIVVIQALFKKISNELNRDITLKNYNSDDIGFAL
ncbi:acyltransferase family protein [Pseudomonas sp. DG56-2]|uniref:acyltransferase family protein n=1 Tax=Pseudomonas sp. DG56-2 TaxID=2320270 RepID=UPI0010A62FE6|nr:acyltransferase family protein [Pseudomonas sp. DG56-2]